MFKCGLFNVDWADLDDALARMAKELEESLTRQNTTSKVYDKFVIEMPGTKKETIKVQLKDEFVYVDWTDYNDATKKKAFYVGPGGDDITVKYDNGLLRVNVKQKTTAKARDIPVN